MLLLLARFFVCLVLPALLLSCRAAADGDDAPSRQAAATRALRMVIAHRGSSIDRPENTLASVRRAIEVKATAAEVDVRTSRDGVLVCLHDAELKRTTGDKGKVGERTLAELKKLDAGRWFGARFQGERIPTLRDVLQACKGKIVVLLDLKETGDGYARKIAEELRKHGEPKRALLGVRSVEQAKLLRKLLPDTRQIGLVPDADSIEAFVKASVTTIRLWPRWLGDKTLVPRVRKLGAGLLLGAGKGSRDEVLPLLAHGPDMLSADDPELLRQTLEAIAKGS